MENPEKLVFSNVYLRTQDEDEQNKNTTQCAWMFLVDSNMVSVISSDSFYHIFFILICHNNCIKPQRWQVVQQYWFGCHSYVKIIWHLITSTPGFWWGSCWSILNLRGNSLSTIDCLFVNFLVCPWFWIPFPHFNLVCIILQNKMPS
jgi:hypothetical protein